LGLKLLLDEDSQAKLLVSLLRKSGHHVQTANEAGLQASADSAVLTYAIETHHTLVTQNCADFIELASAINKMGGHHHGIILVYNNNNPVRDMNAASIVDAIDNLEKTGVLDFPSFHGH
jgi:predicted nuclease of predicted toxin-antitoxin system